jgi:hypothetical protein
MHNFAPNFWNSATGSDLYCVWGPCTKTEETG